MKKLYTFIFIIASIGLFACNSSKHKIVQCESYAVTKVWKKTPISIHDEISPKYYAALSNGDTVPCTERTAIGDSITYKFVKVQD